MALPPPVKPVLRPGAIFHYAYLWHREFLTGQTEGRKDRPALALAVAISDQDGRSHVMALPITHLANRERGETVSFDRYD